jgi:hypothetical protein
MSRGRSTTTDLPIPSAIDCEAASLATTCVTCAGGGLYARFPALACGTMHDTAIRTAKPATRVDVRVVISATSVRSMFDSNRAHAETHCIDAAALTCAAVFVVIGYLGIEQAAQRQRNRADLTRQRERLGLLLGQFERRGLSDRGFYPVFLIDRLIDGQHPNISQNRGGGVSLNASRFFGGFVPPRQHDVHAVIRQDETAGARLGRTTAAARIPFAGTAARKPDPFAKTTWGPRIGSPASIATRTIAPLNLLSASGCSDFLMKPGLAASVGHVCQPISWPSITWPSSPPMLRRFPASPPVVLEAAHLCCPQPDRRRRRRRRPRHRVRQDVRLSSRFAFHETPG